MLCCWLSLIQCQLVYKYEVSTIYTVWTGLMMMMGTLLVLQSSCTTVRSLGEETGSHLLPLGRRLGHSYSPWGGDWVTVTPPGEETGSQSPWAREWVIVTLPGEETGSQLLPQGRRLDNSYSPWERDWSQLLPLERYLECLWRNQCVWYSPLRQSISSLGHGYSRAVGTSFEGLFWTISASNHSCEYSTYLL